MVPPKVKYGVWKILNTFIPTRANMGHRHITTDSSYVQCSHPYETMLHLLKDHVYLPNVRGYRFHWLFLFVIAIIPLHCVGLWMPLITSHPGDLRCFL